MTRPTYVCLILHIIDKSSLLSSVESAEAADTFSTGATAQTAIAIMEPKVDVDDAELIDAEKLLEVNFAIAVEKKIAADTVGTVLAHTSAFFLPYVEGSTFELVEMCSFNCTRPICPIHNFLEREHFGLDHRYSIGTHTLFPDTSAVPATPTPTYPLVDNSPSSSTTI